MRESRLFLITRVNYNGSTDLKTIKCLYKLVQGYSFSSVSWRNMLVAWFWTLLASFLQFIQRLSLSFWLSIFVSIFLGYLANFVFSSIVLMCHSRQSIKNFDGPPSRWLHGHTDRVRKWLHFWILFSLTARKTKLDKLIKAVCQEGGNNLVF